MERFTGVLTNVGRLGLASFLLLFLLTSGGLAQEAIPVEGHDRSEHQELLKNNSSPDKSSAIRLNVVGSDAMIHGLTVGRGGGNINSNSAFGLNALPANTTGIYNNAIGLSALRINSTGSDNNALGAETFFNNTTGSNNTAIGSFALYRNTTGSSNIAVGRAPLFYNATGFSNIAIGGRALYHNTVRSNLVAVGDSALHNNGQGVSVSFEATANTALGSKALYANTTGYRNTATGYHALIANTTGYANTATGYQALSSNTTGYNNTAAGYFALYRHTTGLRNTAFGFYSSHDLQSGNDNTSVGYFAGDWTNTISQGTFVGRSAYPNASGYSNVTGIGYSARPTASNQARIGNSTVNSIGGHANWTNFSDGGFKSDVSDDVAGLDFILRLRPVSYHLDVHKLAAELGEDATRDEEGNKSMATPDEFTLKSRDEKAAIRFTGFIAQEVEATVNELGVAFSGVDAPANKSSYYGLRYADFVVPLVKAVQEQQAQIELLEPAAVEALQMELQEVRVENAGMQQELTALKSENELMREQLDQILALLSARGIDLGSGLTNDPSRAGSGRSGRDMGAANARLEQNTPNPFQESTVIRYFLPEDTTRAQLVITDIQGNRIQTSELPGHGSGQVTIDGGSLPAGTYVYSLLINGRVADSKRMVLL